MPAPRQREARSGAGSTLVAQLVGDVTSHDVRLARVDRRGGDESRALSARCRLQLGHVSALLRAPQLERLAAAPVGNLIACAPLFRVMHADVRPIRLESGLLRACRRSSQQRASGDDMACQGESPSRRPEATPCPQDNESARVARLGPGSWSRSRSSWSSFSHVARPCPLTVGGVADYVGARNE